MTASKMPMDPNWIDPDDAPDLSTPEWRAKMAREPLREGDRIVRRGRPKLANAKELVTIRLSPEVLAHYRAGGPGWQTRINETLARAATREKRKA